jgi:hypothetical protein
MLRRASRSRPIHGHQYIHRCWVDVSGTPVSLLGKMFVIRFASISLVKMDGPVKPAPGYCCIPLPSFLGSYCKLEFHKPLLLPGHHSMLTQGDFLFWHCRRFYTDLHLGLLSGDTRLMFPWKARLGHSTDPP